MRLTEMERMRSVATYQIFLLTLPVTSVVLSLEVIAGFGLKEQQNNDGKKESGRDHRQMQWCSYEADEEHDAGPDGIEKS